MNVVTANENKSIIDRLDMDIIKRIDGKYELRELLSKFVNLYFNKMIIDVTSIENYQDIEVIRKLAKAIDPNRVILLLNDAVASDNMYVSNLVKIGFYNFTRNFEGINFLYNTPNTYEQVKHLVLDDNTGGTDVVMGNNNFAQENSNSQEVKTRKIIGLFNLTNHAGATSLTNMMVRQLNASNYEAIGIEMFRNDLIFYHDIEHLFSCMNRNDLDRKLKESANVSVIIMDLNEFGEASKYCDEILYLVEPSYVMITKLLKRNRNIFADHKGDKLVLNKSFVNDQEIPDFEYETKCKVFDNLPPMNDRDLNLAEVNELLRKLGFNINPSM